MQWLRPVDFAQNAAFGENPMNVTLLEISVLVVTFLIIGSLLGSWMAGLVRQKRDAVEAAHSKTDADVQRATLAEQLKSAQAALTQAEQRAAHADAALQDLRSKLDEASAERAQLLERAARIPDLEAAAKAAQADAATLAAQIADLREHNGKLLAEVEARSRNLARLEQVNEALGAERQALQASLSENSVSIARLEEALDGERSQTQQKLALLEQARAQLVDQFKALSNDILEEKSRKFTEINQSNISQLLNPLRERMNEFKAKVEEIHLKDAEQQAALRTELAQMSRLNQQLTSEAHSLATALKGQAKKQGNWGELILGNVLDRSGLREGKDYRREVSFNTQDGRKRPDAIVYLPQQKHLVIDAKVSLNAYTRYVNADDEATRQQALAEHVAAVTARIQELADRKYFELEEINSPDMVFMFIPVESAYVEALKADESLFSSALDKNVLVATPTTLLTSLNIVRQLWRFEEQNQHTAELAARAAKIHKKLTGFVASMTTLGAQLGKAKDSYDAAMGQLSSGRDNLIKQARDFENLGVAVHAPLPPDLVARAELELELVPAPEPQPEQA